LGKYVRIGIKKAQGGIFFKRGRRYFLFLPTVKPEDFPVFQGHQVIIFDISSPDSTKQAQFLLF